MSEIVFFDVALRRMLIELCLVGILKMDDGQGKARSNEDILKDLELILKVERDGIGQIGRRNAARVYGSMEGRRSSMRTVDFVLHHDYIGHYRKMLSDQKAAKR